jgi:GGDEF domain-containing protein
MTDVLVSFRHLEFEVEGSNARLHKRVHLMTEGEKTRALLTDDLTGLGNRRAWQEGDRLPVQVMLEVEGLKWANDNVGWAAGNELLCAVADAIREEGIAGCRLGGDEFVFETEDRAAAQASVDRIQRRLRGAEIAGTLPDGSRRRLRGPRIHAGIGRSLKEAHAELNAAKKAGLAARKRAGRGNRPRGLQEGGLVSFLKRKESQLRFYFLAFREADPDFREKKTESGVMSRAWLIRRSRSGP